MFRKFGPVLAAIGERGYYFKFGSGALFFEAADPRSERWGRGVDFCVVGLIRTRSILSRGNLHRRIRLHRDGAPVGQTTPEGC